MVTKNQHSGWSLSFVHFLSLPIRENPNNSCGSNNFQRDSYEGDVPAANNLLSRFAIRLHWVMTHQLRPMTSSCFTKLLYGGIKFRRHSFYPKNFRGWSIKSLLRMNAPKTLIADRRSTPLLISRNSKPWTKVATITMVPTVVCQRLEKGSSHYLNRRLNQIWLNK